MSDQEWTPKQKARKKIVGDAMRQGRKLQRPEGIGKVHWRTVHEVLVELARHVPDIWPSQRYIAKKLDLSLSTVHKAVKTAEDHGLLKRTTHANKWRFDGVEYHLPWLVSLSDVSPAHGTDVGPPLGTSSYRDSVLGSTESRSPMSSSLREEKQGPVVPFGNDSNNNPAAAAAHAETNRAEVAAKQKPNERPGECVVCGKWVSALEGTTQAGENPWLEPVHRGCFGSRPGSGDPAERAKRKAQMESLRQQRDEYLAQRDREWEEYQARISAIAAKPSPSPEDLASLDYTDLLEVGARRQITDHVLWEQARSRGLRGPALTAELRRVISLLPAQPQP